MNRDFTIIFEKMQEDAGWGEVPEPRSGAVMLTGENFAEMDELAELRRVITEITEPAPSSFTIT
jgi:hypothetical protein